MAPETYFALRGGPASALIATLTCRNKDLRSFFRYVEILPSQDISHSVAYATE